MFHSLLSRQEITTPNSIYWNQDNFLAVKFDKLIKIINPEKINETKLIYLNDNGDYLKFEKLLSDYQVSGIPKLLPYWTHILQKPNSLIFQSICWSSSGCSKKKGCLLASLTTGSKIEIHDIGIETDLIETIDFSSILFSNHYLISTKQKNNIQKTQKRTKKQNAFDPNLYIAMIDKLTFRSICWSDIIVVSDTKYLLLLIGTKSGHVLFCGKEIEENQNENSSPNEFVFFNDVFIEESWIIALSCFSKNDEHFVAIGLSNGNIFIYQFKLQIKTNRNRMEIKGNLKNKSNKILATKLYSVISDMDYSIPINLKWIPSFRFGNEEKKEFGPFLFFSKNAQVFLWNENGIQYEKNIHIQIITGLDFNCQNLFSCSIDGSIKCYNPENSLITNLFDNDKEKVKQFFGFALSPNSLVYASAITNKSSQKKMKNSKVHFALIPKNDDITSSIIQSLEKLTKDIRLESWDISYSILLEESLDNLKILFDYANDLVIQFQSKIGDLFNSLFKEDEVELDVLFLVQKSIFIYSCFRERKEYKQEIEKSIKSSRFLIYSYYFALVLTNLRREAKENNLEISKIIDEIKFPVLLMIDYFILKSNKFQDHLTENIYKELEKLVLSFVEDLELKEMGKIIQEKQKEKIPKEKLIEFISAKEKCPICEEFIKIENRSHHYSDVHEILPLDRCMFSLQVLDEKVRRCVTCGKKSALNLSSNHFLFKNINLDFCLFCHSRFESRFI
ncbi:general transcription factor 3c polypeptide 4 family [Anaeramoeba ignava]|uniref:General transcription factor 3c polypeptide 4 family n=1 Tax=Anaeramoeba ignava TaxID=1746090 RepID=A0A9Q0R7S9_ANAIG|nr:general transcription factor 3c polypeptide 4 family [Anaeramoeba ignava]